MNVRKIEKRVGCITCPTVSGKKILCHICSDSGNLHPREPIAAHWEAVRIAYDQLANEEFALGTVQFVDVEQGITVANIIAFDGQKLSISPEHLRIGLRKVAQEADKLNASVVLNEVLGNIREPWTKFEEEIQKALGTNRVYVMLSTRERRPKARTRRSPMHIVRKDAQAQTA